jgi:hypothetical protein
MKRLILGILIGFIISIILLVSVNVFAGPQTIEAFFNDIKVMINGKIVDADVPLFIYNGRTMVSLRFVSETIGEILGLESTVRWNETTNTAEIIFEKKAGDIMDVTTQRLPDGHLIDYNKLEHNEIINYGGRQYIFAMHVHKDLTKKDCNLGTKNIDGSAYLCITGSDEMKDLLIPYVIFDNRSFIEYDFYLQKIVPFLNQ